MHIIHSHQSSIGRSLSHTDIHDLHAQFKVEITEAEQLRPKTFVAGQRVDTDGQTHRMELCAEDWVGCDGVLVLVGEGFQGGSKGGERGLEVGELIRFEDGTDGSKCVLDKSKHEVRV